MDTDNTSTRTFRHERGTVLANVDGMPAAVVLGHTTRERDLTTDWMRLLSEAAELAAAEWTAHDDVLQGVALWMLRNSHMPLWRYATEADEEAEDETWCGPGFHGDEVWVMAWDPDEAVAVADELGLASVAAEDDDR